MYDLLTDTTPATTPIAATDGERLMRFVRHSDEAAFTEVVEAHSTMVWAVCWHILRQRQDTEDAFQATFLILARKAHTIKANDSAAAWLYRVAFRTALRLKNQRGRRREESLPADLSLSSQSLSTDDQLAAVTNAEQSSALLEELHALPPRYQRPLVLHYLEEKSRAAVAEELGCTTSAIKGRLARGRSMLRSRLARRGTALSAAMAATTTAFSASAVALPVTLPAGTAGLALGFRAKLLTPDGGTIAAGLANKGLAAMTVATLMKPAAGVLTLVLVAALLTSVNAEEEPGPATSNGTESKQTSASVAVDSLAAVDEPVAREEIDVDVPIKIYRPATNKSVEINPGMNQPIPADPPKEYPLPQPTRPSAILPPSDPAQPIYATPSRPVAAVQYADVPAAPTKYEVPAGGKKQLDLERQYWDMKAEASDHRLIALTNNRKFLASKEEKYKKLAEQASAFADVCIHQAEMHLAQSKRVELEARIEQLERFEKMPTRPSRTYVDPPQNKDPSISQLWPQAALPRLPVDPPRTQAPEKLDHEWIRFAPGDQFTVSVNTQGIGGSDITLTVDADGKVQVGPKSHWAKIAGLSISDAEKKLFPSLRGYRNLFDAKMRISELLRGRVLYHFPAQERSEKKLKESARIAPGDTIHLDVTGAFPDRPLTGNFTVESMGTVALGATYGRVEVDGMDVLEAEAAIKKKLSTILKEVEVQVTRLSPQPAPPSRYGP
ncbi:sigma-70 family RNA polymerase sigma factor [Adhaeretor mobilis]|uniref:ECF RNA polymerase sigma factor SigW n=1 Tax=Adhaeretor mobilis TaxID=1930276 RepID=A0A517N3A6_9BACT|nr:sigma-70 family RNA polymerase sigma factor [Adhaeretor mobilis]QDT01621.1 ECF RNA polymerase sigma factor SigW [Adhaeretor mobilis]